MNTPVATSASPATTAGTAGIRATSAPTAPMPIPNPRPARWPFTSIHRPAIGVTAAPIKYTTNSQTRAANVGRRPLVVDVRERDGEDARREEALHEPPEDQLRQARRSRCQACPKCQPQGGSDDHALPAD